MEEVLQISTESKHVEPKAENGQEKGEKRHDENGFSFVGSLLLIDVFSVACDIHADTLDEGKTAGRGYAPGGVGWNLFFQREIDCWHFSFRRFSNFEELGRDKSEDVGDDVSRKDLLGNVEFRRDVVVKLPRETDFVLGAC